MEKVEKIIIFTTSFLNIIAFIIVCYNRKKRIIYKNISKSYNNDLLIC
jgi:hypothetical protein